MTPQVISLSALGSTAWIPVDYKQNPFNISIACVVSNTPNLTYQVEFTLDDIFNPAITPTAFVHNTITGKTSDFSATQTQPVRAIRLTTTAYTSGTVTMTALQGAVNPVIYTPNPITLFQSGVPFWIPPGDSGVNGLSFTGTRGVFSLSAAVVTNFWNIFGSGGYAYLPAGAGGLATGGWYWCVMTSDTAGEIFAETYSGTDKPPFVTTPTALPNLSAGRITQSTSEVALVAFTVPGGSFGPNGRLTWSMRTSGSNAASSKSFRLKLGGTTLVTTQPTTNPCMDLLGFTVNLGTTGRQCNARATTVTGVPAAGSSIGALEISTVDTSVDQTFAFSIQLAANTDTAALIYEQVVIQYGA
jgi:hypothetical protein